MVSCKMYTNFSILHCTRSARARLRHILRHILTHILRHILRHILCLLLCLFNATSSARNKQKYTGITHKKTGCFTSPHAPAVIVEQFSFFFHRLVEASSYAITTFYKIKIGLKLGKGGACTKKV